MRSGIELSQFLNFPAYFFVIGKKNNQTSVPDADRQISTLRSTDNAENSVNLISGIIRLPSDLDFSGCIGHR